MTRGIKTFEDRMKQVEIDVNDCWVLPHKVKSDGALQIRVDGRLVYAHRYFYEQIRGPISAGLVLDHLCRVRRCVNPWHQEPVTNKVNILRGEGLAAQEARRAHCIHGHVFDGTDWMGNRRCFECEKRRNRQYGWGKNTMGYRKKKRARETARRTLPVPMSCERCGDQKADRHHDDYDKPAEITWLCRRCHNLWHKLKKVV